MKIAKELFDTAVEDLSSSRLLYEGKKYSQSFFYFQQSAEKATKAYALLTGLVHEHQLLKIGHEAIQIFKQSLDHRVADLHETMKTMMHFPKAYNHPLTQEMRAYGKTLESGQLVHEEIKKGTYDKPTYAELNDVLDMLEDMAKVKFAPFKEFDSIALNSMEETAKYVESFQTTEAIELAQKLRNYTSQPENHKELIEILSVTMNHSINAGFIGMTLYYSTLLTMKHASKARYPHSNSHPLKIYNRNMPVVNMQEYFMRILSKAFKRMKETFPELAAK